MAARARTIDSGGGLDGRDVSYILTTGNTWKSGIEDFTLNVVKHKPDELVTRIAPLIPHRENRIPHCRKLLGSAPCRPVHSTKSHFIS